MPRPSTIAPPVQMVMAVASLPSRLTMTSRTCGIISATSEAVMALSRPRKRRILMGRTVCQRRRMVPSMGREFLRGECAPAVGDEDLA